MLGDLPRLASLNAELDPIPPSEVHPSDLGSSSGSSYWTMFPWNWQWQTWQNNSEASRLAQCGISDNPGQYYYYTYYLYYYGEERNTYEDYGEYYYAY
eukprot:6464982-Amphidinium_carterae.1